jgi:hypothetical protein
LEVSNHGRRVHNSFALTLIMSNNNDSKNIIQEDDNNIIAYKSFIKNIDISDTKDINNIIDDNNLLFFKYVRKSVYIYNYDIKKKERKLIDIFKCLIKNENTSKLIKIYGDNILIPDGYSLKLFKYTNQKLVLIKKVKTFLSDEIINNIIFISIYNDSAYLLTINKDNKYTLLIDNSIITFNIKYNSIFF